MPAIRQDSGRLQQIQAFDPGLANNPHVCITGDRWSECVGAILGGSFGFTPNSAWVLGHLQVFDNTSVINGRTIDIGSSCEISPAVMPLFGDIATLISGGNTTIPSRVAGYLDRAAGQTSTSDAQRIRCMLDMELSPTRIGFLLQGIVDNCVMASLPPPSIHVMEVPAEYRYGLPVPEPIQVKKALQLPLSMALQHPEALPSPRRWFIEISVQCREDCIPLDADGFAPAMAPGDAAYAYDSIRGMVRAKYGSLQEHEITAAISDTYRERRWDVAMELTNSKDGHPRSRWSMHDMILAMQHDNEIAPLADVMASVLTMQRDGASVSPDRRQVALNFADGVRGMAINDMRPAPLAMILATLLSSAVTARTYDVPKIIVLPLDHIPSDHGIGDQMLERSVEHILRVGRKFNCSLWLTTKDGANHPQLFDLAQQRCANRMANDDQGRWMWHCSESVTLLGRPVPSKITPIPWQAG